MASRPTYVISTDPSRLDLDVICDFLRTSYWARNVPRQIVERAVQNSLCFGAYLDGKQVGFARVVTDRSTFGYLADVFVVPEHRGKGVSKLLLRTIIDHPDLQGLRRLLLATRDAHGLYSQFGFQPLSHPDHFMSIHRPDVYLPKPEEGGDVSTPNP